jgi:hypothetical protein
MAIVIFLSSFVFKFSCSVKYHAIKQAETSGFNRYEQPCGCIPDGTPAPEPDGSHLLYLTLI